MSAAGFTGRFVYFFFKKDLLDKIKNGRKLIVKLDILQLERRLSSRGHAEVSNLYLHCSHNCDIKQTLFVILFVLVIIVSQASTSANLQFRQVIVFHHSLLFTQIHQGFLTLMGLGFKYRSRIGFYSMFHEFTFDRAY